MQLSEEQVAGSSFQFSPCPTPLTLVRCFQVTSWCTPCPQVPLPGKGASPLPTAPVQASPLAPPLSWQVPALAAAVHACDVLLVSAGSLLHPPGLHDLHPLTCFLLVPDFALVLITLSCPWWLSDPLGTRFYCLDNPRSAHLGRICSWMRRFVNCLVPANRLSAVQRQSQNEGIFHNTSFPWPPSCLVVCFLCDFLCVCVFYSVKFRTPLKGKFIASDL